MSHGAFLQEGPALGNQHTEDEMLRSYLERSLPNSVLAQITPDLAKFGERVVRDIQAMAIDAEAHPPQLAAYSPWGERIDRIETSSGWRALEQVAASEGLVAIGYERSLGALSRVYQCAKLYLFTPSSAMFTCPLAMTDGAARLIEVHGSNGLKSGAFSHLISRDPQVFWTSGQWMTERRGGSDVSRSETRAEPDKTFFRLFGTKWFSSATTSQMAFTLARIKGTKGLSLFYLETHGPDGRLNGIEILRLKDKLGTKALPTAELELIGCKATLVGEPGQGVKQMAVLLNVTRIYNAVAAVAIMRRALALARDYAHKRLAFGKLIGHHPLHVETLAALDVELRAAFHLTFFVVELLGRVECEQASAEDMILLRMLTPVVKLYTAKRAVALVSEALECFGGAGYIEDTGIPKWLRDVQVLTIWEGTTNVLSLDLLRAVEKTPDLATTLKAHISRRLDAIKQPALASVKVTIQKAAVAVSAHVERLPHLSRAFAEAAAREFAFSVARLFAAIRLSEQAEWQLRRGENASGQAAKAAAQRYCRLDLATLPECFEENDNIQLALGERHESMPQNGRC